MLVRRPTGGDAVADAGGAGELRSDAGSRRGCVSAPAAVAGGATGRGADDANWLVAG